MDREERFMLRAIELSKGGFPAPNPHVACVIVKNDEIVGEGLHDHAGGPHAEVVALQQAGQRAKGAEVFVTLEPCNHQGRTPPCSLALIEAGVSSVTIACLDPNPNAAGGVKRLQEAGIKVNTGVCEKQARQANERWLIAVERKRPFIEAKVAMSLDGRVALPNGDSKWITNETSRKKGHRLRAECGAVLVGRKTVERDDPYLTARIDGVVNQPTRIVLDPNSVLTRRENVFNDAAPTWHVVKRPVHEGQIRAPMRDNHLDLPALLQEFFEKGITAVLVEGGPVTLGHLMHQGLVDRLNVFIAPKALGAGPSWMQESIAKLDDAMQFQLIDVTDLDGDLWIIYRPKARSI